jgi:alkylation response protein AidB-like acyl-CoA dehydrogenase
VVEWTEQQRRLRDSFRRWHGALSADHLRHDRAGSFPRESWQAVRESGILRLPFGKQWGGLGHDLLTTMYVLEDLGHGCRDSGLNFSVATHIVSTGVAIERFGPAELRARYLPQVCDGSAIGAHAISEPERGSDVMSMTTTATRDGEHFVLDGRKAFVSNGPVADLVVVYARTDATPGPFGITAFLLERDTPGLVIGPSKEKMGLRSSPFCEMSLEGCRVAARNVVGRPGAGFVVMDHVLKREILYSFIITVGEMQHRLERCVDYARTRTQFGQAIGAFQSVANKIVEMKIGVETSRKWLYDTAHKLARHANVTTDIAISKLVASESNVASALAAVQIFGGRGYTTEYGIEIDLRSAVAGTIYSGTSEVHRQRIAQMLGLGPPRRSPDTG